MKKNRKGFSVIEVLIVVVFFGLIATVAWLVYDRQKAKDANDNKITSIQNSQQEPSKELPAKNEDKVSTPDGWVVYQDTSNAISFYHPPKWDKSKFNIYKTSVSETIKGTNFGPYSAKFIFKKSENKWYAIDFDGNQIAPYAGYTTVTTLPASTYPAVYGFQGEGGGSSYYAVFTDGSSSYLIELPVIKEDSDPNGLNDQKQAIADLVNTIKISN